MVTHSLHKNCFKAVSNRINSPSITPTCTRALSSVTPRNLKLKPTTTNTVHCSVTARTKCTRVNTQSQSQRFISTSSLHHQIPSSSDRPAPQIPRAQKGLPTKRRIPNVSKVVAVASGKGGVGKSTVATNLALALSQTGADTLGRPPRIGLLDLDVFGPSIPKLMALENAGDPELSPNKNLLPMMNYGIKCMSMGFLLPEGSDTAVVWRGLMVMKAVQQLLFDVDWSSKPGSSESESTNLDVLVIDLPPGTGDVQLSLSQLVKVDGAVIVSTPQDVALIDVKKGINMFNKVDVPIIGTVLNMSHFICSSCSTPHEIFGSPESFKLTSEQNNAPVLSEIPLESATSDFGDQGKPIVLSNENDNKNPSPLQAPSRFRQVASNVWSYLTTTKK